jgi:hypothetical protein
MHKIAFLILAAAAVFGADDPWLKVNQLKTGSELRIYKVGAKQPVLAKFSDVSDESLIITTKDEESAIPKKDIERIDYRPPSKSGRVTTESKTTTNVPDTGPVGPRPTPGAAVPSTSSSSSVSIGNKADFETIYRRTTVPGPAK